MSFFNLNRSLTFLSAGRSKRLSRAVTNDPGFQTILIHSLPSDDREQMTFDLFGEKLLDGFEFVAFQLEATAICPGGLVEVLGSTEIFAHKTAGAMGVTVHVIGDGLGGVLLEVAAPAGEWSWKIEASYKKLDI